MGYSQDGYLSSSLYCGGNVNLDRAMTDFIDARKTFEYWFSAPVLKRVFQDEVSWKPTVGIDKTTVDSFRNNLDENIEVISRKAPLGTYCFTNYAQRLIAKGPNDPPRKICIPTIRDKVTLKAISHILDDLYGHSCVTGQPQAIIDSIANEIHSDKFDSFVKFDISRFYSSIDHGIMTSMIEKRTDEGRFIQLVVSAITTPAVMFGRKSNDVSLIGLPEGLSISNRLANVYLSELDDYFREKSSISYFRYVDDILILCGAQDVNEVKKEMQSLMAALRLNLNGEKTKSGSLRSDLFDYLGYRFSCERLQVCPKAQRNIENAIEFNLRNYDKEGVDRWVRRFNLRITGCRVTEDGGSFHRYGWLYYYSRANDVAYLGKLDYLIEKIAKRRGIKLPASIKSFRKAFYEMRYRENSTSYIPTFDKRATAEWKKEMLDRYFGVWTADKTDEEIEALFTRLLRRELSYLERDIGTVS